MSLVLVVVREFDIDRALARLVEAHSAPIVLDADADRRFPAVERQQPGTQWCPGREHALTLLESPMSLYRHTLATSPARRATLLSRC